MPRPFRLIDFTRLALVAVLTGFLAGPTLAQDGAAVVATVNGQPVTEADLALAESELDQQFSQLPAAQRRAAALTAVIEIRLMAAAAEAAGLADDPEFERRMELLRQRALHSAYIESEIADTVTEEMLRARYDEEITELDLSEEVRARHIIVETEEQAAGIIGQLDAGGDFEVLAREHSQDGAAQQGGDLGYFGRGQMVGEFEEAAFAMEVGAHSAEPVETQFGWHVIQLVNRRAQTPPTFEQVQQQLRSLILREAYFEAVQEMRNSAEIEIEDADLRQAMDGIDGVEEPAAVE